MNWPRICSGAVLAAILLWLVDFFVLGRPPFPGALYLIFPELVIGIIVCGLYVLARPRLGPGPKTAIVMGSVAFVLIYSYLLDLSMWFAVPGMAVRQALLGWVKVVAATYIAGWQYIERAP